MEPEDLLGAGDQEPNAGANELRAIVARAQRRRWRVGVGGLTAALLVGGGAGYALSNHSSSGQSVATSPASASSGASKAPSEQSSGSGPAAGQSGSASSASSAGEGSAAGTGSVAPLLPERLQALFTRTAGSVDIRGFLVTSTIQLPQGRSMPSCLMIGPRFQAEVSTPKMVGTVAGGYVPPDSTQALSGVSAGVVGTAEGDPTLVVTAFAGKGVAEVKASGFSSGETDSMAPAGGWVALAGPTTSPSSAASPVKVGTITALSASGTVLASESVTAPTELRGGPLPLSTAAGAEAANGASVVCEGGTSGSGIIVPGTSTGTVHVACPPAATPLTLPGATTGTGGGVQSNAGSTAGAACTVRVEPALGGSTAKAAG
jgi:hypothetical protein